MKFRQTRRLIVTPTNHPSIHATNILKLDTDKYLIVWFGGTREKHVDTAIWAVIYNSGNFSSQFRIAKLNKMAHWNPILMWDGDRILCYFKTGAICSIWRTWVMSSPNGVRWSRPRLLVHGDSTGRGPSKNKPIILSNGRWLAPGSNEYHGWSVLIDRSDDRGETWRVSSPIRSSVLNSQIIQPAIWESIPGYVHLLARSATGRLWRSDSNDFGETWSSAYETDIPNNNSGVDITKHNEFLVMAYNPIAENWGRRTPLDLAVSSNNGMAWRNVDCLEDGVGEFSYPSIVSDGYEVAVSYTRFRQTIGLVLGNFD